MATSANLKAAQTGDDRNTSKKLEVEVIHKKKLLVVTLSAIIGPIIAWYIDCRGRPKGALSKKRRRSSGPGL
jgi:hypothetical protein